MRSLALVLLLVCGGCVRLQWERTNVGEPVSDRLIEGLVVGADLSVCLERLGAPHRVWETERGMAISYGWLHARQLGFSVSVNVARFVTVSYSYDDERGRMRGAVLWFDNDLKLIRARTGLLSEITPRRRPSVEET